MNSIREFFETIRVEHTVFALPFAYATLFLAGGGWPTASNLIWITVAMVAARTVGMAVNRVIDAEIDARNPRTASRAIPAGRLRSSRALAFSVVALALFVAAVWQLHPVCRKLWPIVIAAMVAYPYAKRVTPYAHLVLGAVYFMVPTSVWLAVTGELSLASVFLGLGAGAWVTGFDIIYACQDVEVDRREGLHSIPADFGVARGLGVAFTLHMGFVACLVIAGSILSAGRPYYIGVLLTTLLLMYEHRLVKPNDLSKVNAAFFTTNGIVSIALFALIALDTVI
ncbi:MAG: putative 4-hydroxybenzoate polyprenyltransferase [Candidatus Latescibacteria bacterium]|nr:putative 4-hydroxybenzoate polyprenyltransferase [Candidatus Latescibacterota bacterium]